MPTSKRRAASRAAGVSGKALPAERAPRKGKEGLGASALPDLSIWAQFARLGGQLKPTEISQIIREADTGYPARLIDLWNESRQKDGHVQSVCFTRESAVAGLDWELCVPGEERLGKKAKRPRGGPQKRFVEECLKEAEEFSELIAHLCGAIFPGFAVAETVERRDARGRVRPVRWIRHAARRFGFRSSDSRLVLRDSGDGTEGVDFRARFPDAFVVAQPRINGDVPSREGLARLLVWPASFRNYGVGDLMKLIEMVGKPWRLAQIKRGSYKEDKDAVERALARLTSSGVATVPDTVDLKVEWPKGADGSQQGAHASLIDLLGREISKAVLGQTLTTEQGRVGSQALGNVHNEVRGDILESDARFVAAVITRDIIKPLVRRNFGETAPVPVFRFITEDREDMKTFSEGLMNLKNAGLRIPASWVRDELGIPAPDEDEEVLGGGAGGGEDEDDQGDDPTPEDEDSDDQEAA